MTIKHLAFILLISLIIIGGFGFISMNHNSSHDTGCVASTILNTPCPENIIAMSIHHLQAYVSFFSVIPVISLLFLLTMLLFYTNSLSKLQLNRNISFNYRLIKRDSGAIITSQRKIIRWLSLLENSPSII